MAKLTAKQQKFVDEYMIDLNGTQAAIRAGYSVKTANEIAAQNLAKISIQTELAKRMAIRSRRTGINQDRIVMELAKVAFVNIKDIVDDDGRIRSDAAPEDLACVESVKVKTSSSSTGDSEEREVKLLSKMKALELLGKHMGMWNDKVDMNITLPVVISGEDQLED